MHGVLLIDESTFIFLPTACKQVIFTSDDSCSEEAASKIEAGKVYPLSYLHTFTLQASASGCLLHSTLYCSSYFSKMLRLRYFMNSALYILKLILNYCG